MRFSRILLLCDRYRCIFILKYVVKLEFLRGGRVKFKNFLWEGCGYFLE